MINIKIFNIKTRKEIEGIVGLVTTIKRKENKLLITSYYFTVHLLMFTVNVMFFLTSAGSLQPHSFQE